VLIVHDKNGPAGARGASFGGSWTLLLTPSALREPLQPLVSRLAKRPKLRWAAELAGSWDSWRTTSGSMPLVGSGASFAASAS
jgi:hypothetical protein